MGVGRGGVLEGWWPRVVGAIGGRGRGGDGRRDVEERGDGVGMDGDDDGGGDRM